MDAHFVKKPVGRNQMIYDPERDAVHILNPTANLIEELNAQGLDADAIAQEIRRRFSLEGEDTILADVRTCLATLQERGLIQPGDPART